MNWLYEDEFQRVTKLNKNILYVETIYYYSEFLKDISNIVYNIINQDDDLQHGYHAIYNLNSFLENQQVLSQDDIENSDDLTHLYQSYMRISLFYIFDKESIITTMFEDFLIKARDKSKANFDFYIVHSLEEALKIINETYSD